MKDHQHTQSRTNQRANANQEHASGGNIGFVPPSFSLTASNGVTIQRTPNPSNGYPAGYEVDDDQFLAEHQRDMRNLIYPMMSTSELLEEAIELQAILDERRDTGDTHNHLEFEQAAGLIFIRHIILDRIETFTNIATEGQTTELLGGVQDDLEEVIPDVNDPLVRLEMAEPTLPDPLNRRQDWQVIVDEGVEYRESSPAESVSSDNPALSGRRRGGRNPAATEYRLAPYIAELFSRGPGDMHAIDPNDVVQGELSDCYFMASIAAVANVQPEALARLIHDNGDGTYDITLYVSGDQIDPVHSQTITVTPDVPTNADGERQYAGLGGVDEPELWVHLIEKAYAQVRGGYRELDRGGTAVDGLFALTGREGTYIEATSLSAEEIENQIQNALDEGWPVIAGTPSGRNRLRTENGILNWHMYYITGITYRPPDRNASNEAGELVEGDNFLELSNPWGSQHLRGDQAISFDVFRSTFHGFTILENYDGSAPQATPAP